jgi:hypothetical protein
MPVTADMRFIPKYPARPTMTIKASIRTIPETILFPSVMLRTIVFTSRTCDFINPSISMQETFLKLGNHRKEIRRQPLPGIQRPFIPISYFYGLIFKRKWTGQPAKPVDWRKKERFPLLL